MEISSVRQFVSRVIRSYEFPRLNHVTPLIKKIRKVFGWAKYLRIMSPYLSPFYSDGCVVTEPSRMFPHLQKGFLKAIYGNSRGTVCFTYRLANTAQNITNEMPNKKRQLRLSFIYRKKCSCKRQYILTQEYAPKTGHFTGLQLS